MALSALLKHGRRGLDAKNYRVKPWVIAAYKRHIMAKKAAIRAKINAKNATKRLVGEP